MDLLQMLAAGRTEIRAVDGEGDRFVFFGLGAGKANKEYPSYAEALSAAAFDIAGTVMGSLNISDEEWDSLGRDQKIKLIEEVCR